MKELFKKTQQLLNKYSDGRTVLVFFIITQIVYFIMLFYTIPSVTKYIEGMKLLDMQPAGYSADYVKILFETLGNEGRKAYLFKQIPMDMIYPLLFAVTYSLLLTYLFKRIFTPESKLRYLNLIPVFGGLFDYLENTGIIIMLSVYPQFSASLAKLTAFFSVTKSIFTSLFFLILIAGTVKLIFKTIAKRQKAKYL